MNVLAINIGNTRVAFGIFTEASAKKGKPFFGAAYPFDKTFTPALPAKTKISRVVIASVNPPVEKLVRQWAKTKLNLKPMAFPKDFAKCIKNKYKNPRQTGADRLAGAIAAWAEFRSRCIVIDAGTAVTVDAVSARGEFLGGAILPGLRLQATALHRGTMLLPKIKLPAKTPPAIGKSTEDGIAAGIARGVAGAIVRLIADIEKDLGLCKIIITGGDGEYLAKLCKTKMAIRPNLVLTGIAIAGLDC